MCEIKIWFWDSKDYRRITFQCRMANNFSTFKIPLAKISEMLLSFHYEQEDFFRREAFKLFKELFIGDI